MLTNRSPTLKAVALLTLALVLSACGSDGDDSASAGNGAVSDTGSTTDRGRQSTGDSFVNAVVDLIASSPDNTEPTAIDSIAVTTPDNSEPVPIR